MFVSLIRLLLRLTAAKFSPRNLNHRLRRHCTAPGAAFLIQKIQYFPQRVCVRRVPQERPLAPHLHQPHLLQLFQMVRECRSRYTHLFLHLSHNHPPWMRRQQQPQNLQTRLCSHRRKPQRASGHQIQPRPPPRPPLAPTPISTTPWGTSTSSSMRTPAKPSTLLRPSISTRRLTPSTPSLRSSASASPKCIGKRSALVTPWPRPRKS